MAQLFSHRLSAVLIFALMGAVPASNVLHAQQKAVEGKIVGSHVNSVGQLVVQLDVGAAQGITAGMAGALLVGPSGDKKVLHGGFKIMRVTEPGRSTGRLPTSGVNKLPPDVTRVHVFVR